MRKIKLILSVFAMMAAVLSCNSDDDSVSSDNNLSQLEENIALVNAAANNNFNEKNTENVTNYINENQYIQHAINGRDGVEALIELINFFKENIPTFQTQNIRSFAEGDLVITQNEESIEGNATGVSIDLYRIENGLIVEHWDAVQDYTDTEPLNDNGIVEGTAVNPSANLDKERMRSIAQEYFRVTWNTLSTEAIDEHVSDNFIQHNPQVADGKQPLKDLVNFLANSEDYTQSVEIARTIVYGDFAVVHAKWTDPSGSYAVFDILRFDENYKIVEHWDAFGKAIPEDNSNPRDPVF